MQIFQVRFNHEVLGFLTEPVSAETYDEAGAKLKTELKEKYPHAMFRLAPEQPIPLSDEESAAQEE